MNIFRAFLHRGKRVTEHDIQVLEADKKALTDMLDRRRNDLATARRQIMGLNNRAFTAELQYAAAEKRAEEAMELTELNAKNLARTVRRAEEAEAKLAEALVAQKTEVVRRKPGRPRKVKISA